MGLKNKLFKTGLKGFVLTQKAKYTVGVVVLVVALIGGGVLWYVEERANKPGEATGIEKDSDDDSGLQVGETETQEDFEDFEDDFVDADEEDGTDDKDKTNTNNKGEGTKDPLKDNDNDKEQNTGNSKDSGWGRLF